VEASGNYRAVGPMTRYGHATGAYQMIDSTWGGYRGYSSANLAPPEVQDQRARQLMSGYYREFGRWDLVAVAWHAGVGTAREVRRDPDRLRGVGDANLSTAAYVRRVLSHTRSGAGAPRSKRRHAHAHQPLRPWHVPRNTAGADGRIIVDPALLLRLSRQLTDHLATVDAAYRHCRRATDDLGQPRLADTRLTHRLRAALTEALDDEHGLRRIPHLLSRDLGFVVEARDRALRADGDNRHERRTVDRLIASMASSHDRGTRRHVAGLMRQLFRPERHGGNGHRDAPTTPAHGDRGTKAGSLADVRLGRAWSGTKSIFDQFVTPFLHQKGLSAGSQKRTHDTVDGEGMSDHYTGSRAAYAVDYPTTAGADEARALARALGHPSWQPNSYDSFTVRVDGQQFRVQILWGAGIDHDDHVHVGIRRA